MLELLQQLGLGAAGLDRAAGRQPRQHGRVRQSAARDARERADHSRAAPRRGSGGGRGAVRRGFAEDFAQRIRVEPETVATAIRIGDPASWDRAVRAIRETNGVVTSVTDAEILEAKAVIDAAAWAASRRARRVWPECARLVGERA